MKKKWNQVLSLGCSMSVLVLTFTAGAYYTDCIKIRDGLLEYSATSYLSGQPLELGYDDYGYNYHAHMFNGSYYNAYSNGAGFPPYEGDADLYLAQNPTADGHWAWPYRDVNLMMKWNEGWLANTDCDGDWKLDRHADYATYIGSGAWLTNHMSGSYEMEVRGVMKTVPWTYFVKIVAAPEDAEKVAGVWYTANDREIGADIWGEFAVIQQVENDPFVDVHGRQYVSPFSSGFGRYTPDH